MDIIDARIETYAEAHTTPGGELFERLAAETREKTTWPGMMVGDTVGLFLEFLVRLRGALRVLEIGTFTGYSSLCMARGLREGGQIITCDVNAETTAIARRYAEEAGLTDRIDYRIGPALETVSILDGPFDLVFIDADKTGYLAYYEAVLPKLAAAGLIVADNSLMSGRVVEEGGDELTRAMKDFNDHVRNDPRVECVLLTVRDGMLLAMKR